MQIGKERIVSSETQNESPQAATCGDSCFGFRWKTDHQVYYRLILAVKPFAYVVGNYTCHNRKGKGKKLFEHLKHLHSVASIGDGNKNIIAYICSGV